MNTDRQLSPYAATKKAAEAMAYTYHFLHKLDVSVLRYFTVYGPAGRPDMTPLRFVQRIREGRRSRFSATVRSRGILPMWMTSRRGPSRRCVRSGYEIFNLGSDEPLKLSAMIGLIEELVGQKARIEYRPWHPADMMATWADISKARATLGWSPKTSFREGLGRLVVVVRGKSGVGASMRFEPVRAEAGFDHDGHAQFGQRVFHPVLHDGENAFLFGQVEIEDEFVVDLEQQFRAPVFRAGHARRFAPWRS
jgi:hypothetical protein